MSNEWQQAPCPTTHEKQWVPCTKNYKQQWALQVPGCWQKCGNQMTDNSWSTVRHCHLFYHPLVSTPCHNPPLGSLTWPTNRQHNTTTPPPQVVGNWVHACSECSSSLSHPIPHHCFCWHPVHTRKWCTWDSDWMRALENWVHAHGECPYPHPHHPFCWYPVCTPGITRWVTEKECPWHGWWGTHH